MLLSDLTNNEKGIITKVKGRGAFRKRIIEMGFVKGKEVTVVKSAPLKDPVQYSIMGYEISLRRNEASLIEVVSKADAEAMNKNLLSEDFKGTITSEILRKTAQIKEKIINVALIGNPNAGKTTIFNHASGSQEHVGNYSGVTVNAKLAQFKISDYTFNIIDLPGTYSLTAYSPEELYVRKYILENTPDLIINIVDATNLERNLYLTTQLIDMDVRVVMALNMYDELEKRGDRIDCLVLGQMLGIPIIPTIGKTGKGIDSLFYKLIEVYEDASPTIRHIHINYGEEAEKAITHIQDKIKIAENYFLTDKISSRFLAIKLLEKDKDAAKVIESCANANDIKRACTKAKKRLEDAYDDDCETIMTDAKYGFINGAIKGNFHEGALSRNKRTETIDTFLTHKIFGFPIFIFFIWIMFQGTFSLGAYPMEFIEMAVVGLSDLIAANMTEGPLKDLLIDGIIGGVGGVIVFLPNILILFFFISLMEDSGYMARTAFIMDKLMQKIGLHGKSFIPLIMGFGCNVPAIMATRTLDNKNDRLLTMLINPFMSCSARLPVYLLVIGAVFTDYQGTMLFTVYFSGIIMAILVALVLKKTLFKSKQVPFVMELPPYRIPTLKTTIRHMWNKGKEYLKKMGGVILVASVIIWALGYFPREVSWTKDYEAEIAHVNNNYDIQLRKLNATDSLLAMKLTTEKDELIKQLNIEQLGEHQSNSYIGQIGHFIEPAIRPLGFDWKIGVSLLTGAAAKEIVVSTMGVLYHADTENDNAKSLQKTLPEIRVMEGDRKGQKLFTPLVSLAFMLFILIYFPCVAVVAAIKKEAGHWKWALFTVVYTTLLAWLVAFVIYQVGSLLGF